MSNCLVCNRAAFPKACDDHYREQVLCPGCENEVQEMQKWLCPRGRPSGLYDPDLVEWPISEADPNYPNSSVVATLTRDTSRRFVDPWVVFRKAKLPETLKKNEGIYKGYIASLLVCLYFQSVDDQDFKNTMQKAEDLFCDRKFSENGGTRVVNPFRFEIWDQFFDSNLKDELKEVIPDGLITGSDEFTKRSEVFCRLISIRISKPKQNVDSNQKRIAKYLGCICTLNSIKDMFGTEFDSSLDKFNKLLSNIKGSVLNDSYILTPPPAKRQKNRSTTASKSAALDDDEKGKLSKVFDSPVKKVFDPTSSLVNMPGSSIVALPVLGSLSDNDAEEFPPFGSPFGNTVGNGTANTSVQYSHATVTTVNIVSNVGDAECQIPNFLDKIFKEVFELRSIRFKDKQFHEHAMGKYHELITQRPQANPPITPCGETGRRLGHGQSFTLEVLHSHKQFCEYVKECDQKVGNRNMDYHVILKSIFEENAE